MEEEDGMKNRLRVSVDERKLFEDDRGSQDSHEECDRPESHQGERRRWRHTNTDISARIRSAPGP